MYAKDARLSHRVACAFVTVAMATSVFAALPTFAQAEDEAVDPVEAEEVVEDVDVVDEVEAVDEAEAAEDVEDVEDVEAVEDVAVVEEEVELTASAVEEEPEDTYELTVAAPPQVGWVNDGVGWKYYDQNGTEQYGFVLSKGKYYYLDEETGYMKSGTTFTSGGKNYICDADGVCPTSTWVKLGSFWYYTGVNHGDLCYGWIKVDGKNYWLDDTGVLRIGKFTVAGKTYIADNSGVCTPNAWVKYGTEWYYTDANCACKTGWVQYKDDWYYLNPDNGVMVTGWLTTDGGKTIYYLNDSGAMANGWKKISGDWYYFRDSGAMATGWIMDEEIWYYLDPSHGSNPSNAGAMISNKKFNDGKNDYIAKASGECPADEWIKYDGKWYRTDANCMIRKGWYQADGDWYFSDSNGKMLSSCVFTDSKGNLYIASASGACPANTWVKLSGYWYFAGDSCALRTGWVQYKEDWYYLDKTDGHMLTSTTTPDGYDVDANGKWIKS